MRITIVTGAFLPLPPASCGAIERLWHDLGREFAARGHRVTMVSRSWPGQRGEEEGPEGVRYVRRSGFTRTNRLGTDLAKDLAYSLRVLPAVPAGDVVVTNVFWLPAVLAAVRPGAGKVVVNVARAPKRQMALYRGVARLAATSRAVADQIVAQSPSVAPLVRVLPNPIDTAAFVPPERERAFGGTGALVYTGRVHPEKGVHVLVEAFAELYREYPGLRLRVVGPSASAQGGGGEDYMRDLRARAAGLPVEFLPPIHGRVELARELQGAAYYCYPSLAEKGESFGVAPLEAMATGLTPVVSDLACFRDFLEDGETGAVFDHRGDGAAARLAEAVRSLIRDPGRTAQMSRRAAEVARGFGIGAVAEKFLADFRELTGAAAGAGGVAAAAAGVGEGP